MKGMKNQSMYRIYMWEESLRAVGQEPAGISHDEYRSRQSRLFSQLRPGDLLIITAPHESTRSNDVHYPFRTSSDMLYLCGWEDPDAVFCASNDDASAASVPRKNGGFLRKERRGIRPVRVAAPPLLPA